MIMKVQGSCDKHGTISSSEMVSKSVREIWERGGLWDSNNFSVIRDLMLAQSKDDGVPFWITHEEAKGLGLPTDRVLNEEETNTFLDWSSGRTSGICSKCFKEWISQ
jgi:hypothetical protein